MLAATDAVSLADWARFYQEAGFKPLPKRNGQKYPSVDWQPYQEDVPTDAEIAGWFGNGADGICLVLDGTGLVVVDCDGPPEQTQQLLRQAGIEIPHACPRVVTGRGRDHFYF